MIGVVWRVGAPEFDVDAFLQEFELEPDAVWHQGEIRRKKVSDQSGFNLSLDQEETFAGMLEDVQEFLRVCRDAITTLQSRGIPNAIDFGFRVGSKQQYVRTLEFPSALLTTLGELGIDLQVTGYPSE